MRLFPTLTKSATGYYSDNFSKWFGRFCDKCGVTDSRLAFHSFRHGFRDAARAADVPSEVARELGGWSDGDDSTSEDYGKPSNGNGLFTPNRRSQPLIFLLHRSSAGSLTGLSSLSKHAAPV